MHRVRIFILLASLLQIFLVRLVMRFILMPLSRLQSYIPHIPGKNISARHYPDDI